MSDTPRTDVFLIAWDFTPEPKRIIEHARSLERELNAWMAYAERLEKAGDEMASWEYHPANLGGDASLADAWETAKDTKP